MNATALIVPIFLVGLAVQQYFSHKDHKIIMSAIDDLTAQVAQTKTVAQSAVVLIQGLADALKAAGTDPVKLAALVKDLQDTDTALAAAVTANTPPVTPAPTP